MRLFYIIFIGFCLIGYSLLKPTLDQVSSEIKFRKEYVSSLKGNCISYQKVINEFVLDLAISNKIVEFPRTPYKLKKDAIDKKYWKRLKNPFTKKAVEIVQIYQEPEENDTKFEPNVPAGDIAYFVKKNGAIYDYCSIYTSDVYGNILRSRKNNKIRSIKLVIENNNMDVIGNFSGSD